MHTYIIYRIRIGLQLLGFFGAEKQFAANFRAEKSQESGRTSQKKK
jgi:hypothetical protein